MHSLGLDSGAGNGKYLPTAHAAGHAMIALDRSLGLLGIAKEQEGGVDVVRGDLGCRGWRDGVFVRFFLSPPYLRPSIFSTWTMLLDMSSNTLPFMTRGDEESGLGSTLSGKGLARTTEYSWNS
jgi:hypothetical protein